MKNKNGSNAAIAWTIAGIIVVLAAILILVFNPFKGTTGEFNPTFVYFDNHASAYNAEIKDGKAVLKDGSFISLDLKKGDYTLYYKLSPCANPSEKFHYTYSDPNGSIVSYDPLMEKVIRNVDGNTEKIPLSEEEKTEAILKEKLYVLGTENTEPVNSLAILPDGAFNFKADGEAKFLYDAKCSGSTVTLDLYKVA